MTVLSEPVSSKPIGNKRALIVAIRHVRRRTDSDLGNMPNLDFAHRDAEELRDFLIASHGYQADNTILMLDDKNHPEHLWPTHQKILYQIDRLISDAPEDCHFFFYFAGHGVEVEAESDDRASMRADGQENEIVCADGKPILDRILHDHLITPLENVKGAKLFALFDCCHSESLLDLQRGHGPNHYSRVWKIGRDQMFKALGLSIVNFIKMSKNRHENATEVSLAQRRASSKSHSQPTYKNEDVGELNVICLTACRDVQTAHDDRERGLTFTKCFLKAMATKPNITWAELREMLSELIEEIRASYEEYLHDSSSENDGSTKSWTQSPRCSISSHMDLRELVSF